jgi:hypothetical protein
MKKTTPFVLFFIITSMSLMAQQRSSEKNPFSVKFGTPYELPKKHYSIGYFGNQDIGYLQLAVNQGKSLSIQKFGENGNYKSSNMIDLSKYAKGFMSESVQEMAGGKYYWIFSHWDKKQSKEMLMYQVIDVENGTVMDEQYPMLEVEGKIAGTLMSTGFYQFNVGNKYQINRSSDKTKLVVTYRKAPKEKRDEKNKDVIGVKVFDDRMNSLWDTEVTMPYTEQEMNNEDYTVDNSGNVYLLAKVYLNGKAKEKVDGKPNYRFELLNIKPDGVVAKIKIAVEGKFIKSATTISQTDNQLFVSGLYSNKAAGSTDGIYLVKIDPQSGTSSLLNKGFYEFPNEMIKEFESKKVQANADKAAKKDKEQEVSNLVLREIEVAKDGSVFFAGEQYWVQTNTYVTSKGQTITTYVYHYDDIYTMRINADGSMMWAKKIPKLQKGGNGTGNMSFEHFKIDDEDYFFFLDNEKNLNLKSDQVPAVHSDGLGGFFTFVKIDKEGNTTKTHIFDTRQKKVYFNPNDLMRLTPNSIGGRVLADKRYQMLILTK